MYVLSDIIYNILPVSTFTSFAIVIYFILHVYMSIGYKYLLDITTKVLTQCSLLTKHDHLVAG